MIISHKYKFIFIKTRKTAGTSIEVFLSQICGAGDVVTPVIPHVEPHDPRNYEGLWNPIPEMVANRGRGIRRDLKHLRKRRKFYNHIPARAVKNRVPGEVWQSYFKFCVERNPWDKSLSHYHMINSRAGAGMTIDEYLEKGDLCVNYPVYTDSKGVLLVDRVIKYESLNDQLAGVFDELGVPFDGTLGVRAKSEHRKDKRPYQEVLSDKQRAAIEDAFSQEIELHGYVF